MRGEYGPTISCTLRWYRTEWNGLLNKTHCSAHTHTDVGSKVYQEPLRLCRVTATVSLWWCCRVKDGPETELWHVRLTSAILVLFCRTAGSSHTPSMAPPKFLINHSHWSSIILDVDPPHSQVSLFWLLWPKLLILQCCKVYNFFKQ